MCGHKERERKRESGSWQAGDKDLSTCQKSVRLAKATARSFGHRADAPSCASQSQPNARASVPAASLSGLSAAQATVRPERERESGRVEEGQVRADELQPRCKPQKYLTICLQYILCYSLMPNAPPPLSCAASHTRTCIYLPYVDKYSSCFFRSLLSLCLSCTSCSISISILFVILLLLCRV